MENQQVIKNILDISPFACVLLVENYHIKYMNAVMTDFLSIKDEQDLPGISFLDFIVEDEHNAVIDFLDQFEKPQQGNIQPWRLFTLIDAKTTKKNILINSINGLEEMGIDKSIFLVGIPILQEMFMGDIQNHPSINNLGYSSNNKYEFFFNAATVGIAVIDDQGDIEEINPSFINHLGLQKDQFTKIHYSDLFKGQAKESIDTLFNMINKSQTEHIKDVITFDRSDNKHRIIEVSLSNISNKNKKFMMITEDITNQQDTHAALLQSEKLALTGRLAASLAHEINNPLQTSIGCLGLADELLMDDERDLRVYINMAMEELQRSARIVKRLRDLNRKAELSERTLVDIQSIIDDILILTKNRLYDRKIVPVFLYQGPPPTAYASKDQIQQVILNLIMNAIDSMPEGGNLFLDIMLTENLKGVRVRVRDTGIGMTSEQLSQLFEPFHTTKEDGLGLGLFICKQIIDDHNGTLEVDSKLGKGTEFIVWLPSLDFSENGS